MPFSVHHEMSLSADFWSVSSSGSLETAAMLVSSTYLTYSWSNNKSLIMRLKSHGPESVPRGVSACKVLRSEEEEPRETYCLRSERKDRNQVVT